MVGREDGTWGWFELDNEFLWTKGVKIDEAVVAWIEFDKNTTVIGLGSQGGIYQKQDNALIPIESKLQAVSCRAFYQSVLAVGDYDGSVMLLDLAEQPLRIRRIEGEGEAITAISICDTHLAIASEDGTVRLFDLDGQLLHTHELGTAFGLCLSADGSQLAVATVTGLHVRECGSWTRLLQVPVSAVESTAAGWLIRPIDGGLGLLDREKGYHILAYPSAGHWPTLRVEQDRVMALSADAALLTWQLDQILSTPKYLAGEETRQAALLEPLVRGRLDPLTTMVAPRLQEGEALLLLVDQFEELLTSRQQEESAAFVRSFLAPLASEEPQSSRVFLMLTMRSDFMGDCHRFRRLPEQLSSHQYLVPRLSYQQLQRAIEMPLRESKIDFQPELVATLLQDHTTSVDLDSREAHEVLDQLPILQHALARLWQELGPNHRWCLQDYLGEKIQGARALEHHLDQVCRDFPEEVLAKLFARLAENTDGRRVRRPCPLEELVQVAGPLARDIVERMRQPDCNFLTPRSSQPLQLLSRVDISHEAILRQWSRCARWLEQEDEQKDLLLRLSTNEHRHRTQQFQMRDPEVAYFEEWRRKFSPNKAWAARYLADGNHLQKALDFLSASRMREIKRSRRFYGSLSAVFFLLLLLCGFLWWQNRQVVQREAVARQAHIDGLLPLSEASPYPPPPRLTAGRSGDGDGRGQTR